MLAKVREMEEAMRAASQVELEEFEVAPNVRCNIRVKLHQ